MKAGLLTFHRANNIGAALQAAALQQYINENICPCEYVDFIPNNGVPRDLGAVKNALRKGKQIVNGCASRLKNDRAARFDRFYRENYKLSDKTYRGDRALAENPPAYDVVISGSDQILNTTLTGTSESFYLKPWGEQTRKVSYASSLGREDLSQEEYRLIRQELPKFQAISAREQSAADIIARETGKEVSVVVDPVLLLTKQQWEEKCRPVPLNGSYVLAYAMEYSETMEQLLQQQLDAGKKVLLLCGAKSAQRLPGEKLENVGPGEFLTYIKNAQLVITNSFHGSVLSIIFGKQFCCISHSTRNARLQNLLQTVGQGEKLLPFAGGQAFATVEGSLAYEKMLPLIKASQDYLAQAITQS